jgi:asparagine synthase (glutamine-hydrolysing)
MCGIAGLYRFEEPSKDSELVTKMVETLSHRGPDGGGIETEGFVTFGHRRLSIIDLTSGGQPMRSHCGGVLITFNGEIYNYLELRKDLEFIGHQFKTQSDTEVILELYKRWGVEAFKKLNGQFAFAIYDTLRRSMYLVRDLIGEKPLYYSLDRGSVGFGSEVKSLVSYRRALGLPVEMSPRAFSEFLSLNYIAGVETGVQEVFKVRPGFYIQCANGKVSEHQYLAIDTLDESLGQSREIVSADRLEALVRDSVNLRLRSDVPVGVFLSGGVDSSVVAAFAAEKSHKLMAFCADFKESGFSEYEQGVKIAKSLGLELNRVEVDISQINLEDTINQLVRHGDEPLADSSALPVYLLSKATANHVKVVLSGDGGDELFGGYLTYDATRLAQKFPRRLRNILHLFADVPYCFRSSSKKVSIQERLNRFLRNLDLSPSAAHFAWNGMFKVAQKINLVGEPYRKFMDDTFAALSERYVDFKKFGVTSALLRADALTYLPNDILAKVDRMSMAHGLEVRAAYLDPAIIRFSRSGVKINPELFIGKKLLKEVMIRRFGIGNIPSKKLGFSIPVHNWFRGRLEEMFRGVITSRAIREAQIFNEEAVLKVLENHKKGAGNYGFELWGIMIISLWYTRFITDFR